MRQVTATCLFVMICLSCMSQATEKKRHSPVKNYLLTGSMVLAAGAADGFNQALSFHYPAVKTAFPGLNNQYWCPEMSYRNKYKNGDPTQGARFPGSRTWLVFTTDGYHLTRFTSHLLWSGALAVKISALEKKKWWVYAVEAAGYWIVNRAGFAIVYNRF